MKSITLMQEEEIGALLESLDDLRSLIERIVDQATVAVPEPWDQNISELSLNELFQEQE